MIHEIGRGGMATVYEVEHLVTGARLALKALHRHLADSYSIVERFRREARISAAVKSPHIAEVIDADLTGDSTPFLVMERLQGEDLEAVLRRSGLLSPARVLSLMLQVARGLSQAHGAGFVHRDLKPENLFLHHPPQGSPVVKILDFGIAKALDESHGPALTRQSSVLGTPHYMAPEQAYGDEVTVRTDVWAMGIIAFRLLTGQHFWQGQSRQALMAELLEVPPAPSTRAHLPPGFDAWFARSCHADPAQRFPSVMEQVVDLAVALEVGATPAPGVGPSDAPSPQPMVLAPGLRQAPPATPATFPERALHAETPIGMSADRVASPATSVLGVIGLVVIMLFAAGVAAVTVRAVRHNQPASAVPSEPDAVEETEPGPRSAPDGPPFVETAGVLGAVDKPAIVGTVESHMDEVLACYRRALSRRPTLVGRLTLMATIDAKGRVTTSMMALPGLDDAPLRACIATRAQAWAFPPPEQEIASFQYTFELGRRAR
ncbi:MAG: protein kinase [Polyangiaceae bacterium]